MEKNQVFKFFCLKTCSVLDTIGYEKRSQESSVLRNVFRLSLVMEIDKQGGQVLQLRTDKMEYVNVHYRYKCRFFRSCWDRGNGPFDISPLLKKNPDISICFLDSR